MKFSSCDGRDKLRNEELDVISVSGDILQGLKHCRKTYCGWGGLRALITPRALLAGA